MAPRPTPEERRAVAEAVRHHLQADVRSVEKISRHSGRQVYSARLADSEVVLKVLHARKVRAVGCNFAAERLRRAGVPTPRVLAVDRSGRYAPGTFFEFPFLILERASGTPLDRWILKTKPRREELAKILREIGGHLRSIHAIRTPRGFGAINDQGVGRFPSWDDYLEKCYVRRPSGTRVRVMATATLAAEGVLSERQAQAVDELFGACRETVALSEAFLLHNDLTLKNVYVDPGALRVTAILDLHNAIAGDPALELARFYYFYRGRGYTHPLLAGYGQRPADFERRWRLYLVFVLLEKLAWLRERELKFPGRAERDLALLDKTLASLQGDL